MATIRNDLREVAAQWNMHRIRPSVGARCPAGIPDELFFLPYTEAVSVQNLPAFLLAETITVSICEDERIEEFLTRKCLELQLGEPSCVDDCVNRYFLLQPYIIQR